MMALGIQTWYDFIQRIAPLMLISNTVKESFQIPSINTRVTIAQFQSFL
jgi:hypothetical protein